MGDAAAQVLPDRCGCKLMSRVRKRGMKREKCVSNREKKWPCKRHYSLVVCKAFCGKIIMPLNVHV